MAEMAKTYDPSAIEDRLYQEWLTKGYFKGKVNPDKVPYSIVIPPPNVTGTLHMGHILNNTIQDIYIRWNKLRGKETVWVPGTDHASIATEAKVVKQLKEQGISKEEIGREGFLGKAMEWKNEHGGKIIEQLRKLGCACDWDRERFTMDEKYSELVIDTFIDLYKKGYIYKGYRLVNWCPASQSVISDEEVEFEEKNGKLWYFRYPVKDSDEYVVIATTRPETMFGDTAVAIHPENPKLKHLIGKTVILPFMKKEIPVVSDEHADPEKGSGAVKITPGHDPNDNIVGRRHNLEVINIMNPDATLNDNVPTEFRGMERYAARKKVVEEMEKLGLIEKIDNHVHQVSISQRGKVPIEYLMSEQWYLAMKELAAPAIEAVRNGKIKFHPEKWVKTYFNWMDNVQDWCISRQLWWGHRIPAWYCNNPECKDVVMVSKDKPCCCDKCKGTDLRQDEDVLDTWASSWLWPYGVFENEEERNYFYPTNFLVTAPDIIFFWVARMIIAGLEYRNEIPFYDVYFHGLVRDEIGRKMSKSLGNYSDPLDIIAKYGTDALRFTMVRLTPTGNDILFAEEKCEIGRNFANKIWNASRFLEMYRKDRENIIPELNEDSLADKWILSRFNGTLKNVEEKISSFQPNEAVKSVYEFIWNDFCDWYIEMIKGRLNSTDDTIRKSTYSNALFVFDRALKMLHPFMPFITEEIWKNLFNKEDDSILLQTLPEVDETKISMVTESSVELLKEIIGKVRNIRAENNIAPSKELDLVIKSEDVQLVDLAEQIKNLARVNNITFDKDASRPEPNAGFVAAGYEVYIPLKGLIDFDKERERIGKEIERLKKINAGIDNKLSNENFVKNAPEAVVLKEREKQAHNLDTISKLEENLKSLM
ncbi:MAG: valine--tRNA ligase [Candidatus Delongbacteria bacterium]|nr:valine--tRNA ligase [Candidatus Delongbacteria bacterium]MBN2834442.1 valine--tRNA ligase [Candidatus Delongbacteria bacterium]